MGRITVAAGSSGCGEAAGPAGRRHAHAPRQSPFQRRHLPHLEIDHSHASIRPAHVQAYTKSAPVIISEAKQRPCKEGPEPDTKWTCKACKNYVVSISAASWSLLVQDASKRHRSMHCSFLAQRLCARCETHRTDCNADHYHHYMSPRRCPLQIPFVHKIVLPSQVYSCFLQTRRPCAFVSHRPAVLMPKARYVNQCSCVHR